MFGNLKTPGHDTHRLFDAHGRRAGRGDRPRRWIPTGCHAARRRHGVADSARAAGPCPRGSPKAQALRSSVGIVIGAAAFVFFLSLGLGVPSCWRDFPLTRSRWSSISRHRPRPPPRGVGVTSITRWKTPGFPACSLPQDHDRPAVGKGGADPRRPPRRDDRRRHRTHRRGEITGKITGTCATRRAPVAAWTPAEGSARRRNLDGAADPIPVLASPPGGDLQRRLRRAHGFPRLGSHRPPSPSVGRSMARPSSASARRCVLAGSPTRPSRSVPSRSPSGSSTPPTDPGGRPASVVHQSRWRRSRGRRGVQQRGFGGRRRGEQAAAC